MRRSGLIILLAGLVAFAACQTPGKRKAAVPIPAPPQVPQPLPLQPSPASGLQASPLLPSPSDLLIERAKSLYSAGVRAYGAGNLVEAKEAFDQAVALFLEPDFDLGSNQQLRAEFDRLVDAIHGLEVAAVERGDVLSQHKYEPAPIDSFSELTFPVDPRIRDRAQQELQSVHSDLPLVSNEYVEGVLTYFQNRGRQFVTNALTRSGLYQPLIAEALRQEGLPQDLIYVAAAESGFNPFALSRKGAKGIWQLMLSRALEYGLKKDRWVDEREDPMKSTQAAVRHLKDLYQVFGDWYLAMAAYNCGPLNVRRAIEKTGYADFWMLRKLQALPTETMNYVPIIVATALVAKDPEAYGFDIQPEPPLVTDQVVVSVPTDLRLVAQIVERPVEELVRLNPGLLRWTTPPNDPEYVLNLPAGTREVYEQFIAKIPPDKRIWWRTHSVGEGETLSGVAKKFRVTTVALSEANQLEKGTVLEAGSRLVVPLAPGSKSSLARARSGGPRRLYRYRIKRGDTLERIADLFDVTVYQLRRWNGMKGSRLIAGRTLKLYVSAGPAAGSRNAQASRRTASSRRAPARSQSSPARASKGQSGSSPSR